MSDPEPPNHHHHAPPHNTDFYSDCHHMAAQLSNYATEFGNEVPVFNTENEDDDGGWSKLAIPPGYKLKPTDEELIMCYLMPKVWSQPLPPNCIRSVNIYNYTPLELTSKYKKDKVCEEWFFFTPREKKYPNGRRPSRAAGDGYWKATGADKAIRSPDGNVGCKKALVYYSGKPFQSKKTNWIMHEYRVVKAPSLERNPNPSATPNATDMRLDAWVLCRIYQKNQKQQSNTEETSNNQMNGEDEYDDEEASMGVPMQHVTSTDPNGAMNQMGMNMGVGHGFEVNNPYYSENPTMGLNDQVESIHGNGNGINYENDGMLRTSSDVFNGNGVNNGHYNQIPSSDVFNGNGVNNGHYNHIPMEQSFEYTLQSHHSTMFDVAPSSNVVQSHDNASSRGFPGHVNNGVGGFGEVSSSENVFPANINTNSNYWTPEELSDPECFGMEYLVDYSLPDDDPTPMPTPTPTPSQENAAPDDDHEKKL